MREHARTSKAWRLNEVPGPVPWLSKVALDEQRALLTDSQFARLHLNVWTASEDRLVSVEGLTAAVRLPGPSDYRRGTTYRIGADLGLRHDRTAIAVCHAESSADQPRARRVVLDRMIVFEGSLADEVKLAEVEAALVEAWRSYGRPKVRLDPWQAIGLAQRLRRHGISVEEWSYSPQRYGAIATVLYTLLRDGLLDLYDDPELIDELANVRLKETIPGLVLVEHDPGRHDDHAVALGMAATRSSSVRRVERGCSWRKVRPRGQASSAVAILLPRNLHLSVSQKESRASTRGPMVHVGKFLVPKRHYQPPARQVGGDDSASRRDHPGPCRMAGAGRMHRRRRFVVLSRAWSFHPGGEACAGRVQCAASASITPWRIRSSMAFGGASPSLSESAFAGSGTGRSESGPRCYSATCARSDRSEWRGVRVPVLGAVLGLTPRRARTSSRPWSSGASW